MAEDTGGERPPPDLILCDEAHQPEVPGTPVILLTETPRDDPCTIYRYQCFEEIHSQLLRCLTSAQGGLSTRKGLLVSVCSAAGGWTKHAVAVGLSAQIGDQNRSALYLNADPLDLNDMLLDSGLDNGFTKLFLHQNTPEKQTTIQKLFTYDPRHRFRFLSSPDHFLEKSQISWTQWETALAHMRACGLFDVLVVETASPVDPVGWEFLCHSDMVILVDGEHPYEQLCQERFLRQAASGPQSEDLRDKLLAVTVRQWQGTPCAHGKPIPDGPAGHGWATLQTGWDEGTKLYLVQDGERVFDPGGKVSRGIWPIYQYLLERMIVFE